jgi:hypothetical protein
MALNTLFCHQQLAMKCIKSSKKQHYMFRFHLVPHVLGGFCLQGQNSQKGPKVGLLETIHMARRGRAHWGYQPVTCWCRAVPPRALPRHWSMGGYPRAPWSIDSRLVHSVAEFCFSRIEGPTVIRWEVFNRLKYQLTMQNLAHAAFVTAIGSHPAPYDAEVVGSRAGRRPLPLPMQAPPPD